jgi:signal transduction histidine kinase
MIDTAKINMLNAISFEFRLNNPDTSIYYAKQAMDLAVHSKYQPGIADADLYEGMAETSLGNFDAALKNVKAALEIYEQLLNSVSGNKSRLLTQKANAYNTTGNIYYYQSNYPEALSFYKSSLKIRRMTGDSSAIATSISNIANIYVQQGNYSEAIINHFDALKIREKIGDKNGLAISYGNIGNIYGQQKNFNAALNYFFKCLEIKKELGEKRNIATAYNNIGIVYAAQGNFKEARKIHEDALKIRREIGDKQGIGYSLNNLGNIYRDQGNAAEALKEYLACLQIGNDIGDKTLVHYSYVNIGNIYMNQKKFDSALQYHTKGLLLAKEIGSRDNLKQSYEGLMLLDSARGDFKSAFQDYKNFIANRDSMFNEENTKKMIQSQMQYDFDTRESLAKAEQEKKNAVAGKELQKERLMKNFLIVGFALVLFFSLLAFYQQKRLMKERRLREIESMRSRISQDMHDDLSSGLTKISWMSELLKAKAKNTNPEEVTSTLEKITVSARETINNLSEIVWATNPKHDNFESMLSYMRNYILSYFEDSKFNVHIDFPERVEHVKVNPELIRNLFLIMKEGLHNAVKYSDGKHISVHFTCADKKYSMTIIDDGIGMEDLRVQGSGNGLGNIKQRVENMKGEFELFSAKNKGTQIKVQGSVA